MTSNKIAVWFWVWGWCLMLFAHALAYDLVPDEFAGMRRFLYIVTGGGGIVLTIGSGIYLLVKFIGKMQSLADAAAAREQQE
jgi:hypothetical protein